MLTSAIPRCGMGAISLGDRGTVKYREVVRFISTQPRGARADNHGMLQTPNLVASPHDARLMAILASRLAPDRKRAALRRVLATLPAYAARTVEARLAFGRPGDHLAACHATLAGERGVR
jgi:hypothetical protein